MYARRPAEAFFHADCGGSTTSADAVWGGRAMPYLKASSDDQPSLSHRSWRFAVPFAKLREALNRDRRSRVGGRLDGIDIVKRDRSGSAANVALRGDQRLVIRGEDLRAIVNETFGDRAVQSTKLTIAKTRDSFVFSAPASATASACAREAPPPAPAEESRSTTSSAHTSTGYLSVRVR